MDYLWSGIVDDDLQVVYFELDVTPDDILVTTCTLEVFMTRVPKVNKIKLS